MSQRLCVAGASMTLKSSSASGSTSTSTSLTPTGVRGACVVCVSEMRSGVRLPIGLTAATFDGVTKMVDSDVSRVCSCVLLFAASWAALQSTSRRIEPFSSENTDPDPQHAFESALEPASSSVTSFKFTSSSHASKYAGSGPEAGYSLPPPSPSPPPPPAGAGAAIP